MSKGLGENLKILEFLTQTASQESLSTFSSEETGTGKHGGITVGAAYARKPVRNCNTLEGGVSVIFIFSLYLSIFSKF